MGENEQTAHILRQTVICEQSHEEAIKKKFHPSEMHLGCCLFANGARIKATLHPNDPPVTFGYKRKLPERQVCCHSCSTQVKHPYFVFCADSRIIESKCLFNSERFVEYSSEHKQFKFRCKTHVGDRPMVLGKTNLRTAERKAEEEFEAGKLVPVLPKRKKTNDKSLEKPKRADPPTPAPEEGPTTTPSKQRPKRKRKPVPRPSKERHRPTKPVRPKMKTGYLRPVKPPVVQTRPPADDPLEWSEALPVEKPHVVADVPRWRSRDRPAKERVEVPRIAPDLVRAPEATFSVAMKGRPLKRSRGRPPLLSKSHKHLKTTSYEVSYQPSEGEEGQGSGDEEHPITREAYMTRRDRSIPAADDPNDPAGKGQALSSAGLLADRGTWDTKVDQRICAMVRKSDLWVLLSKDAANCPPDGQFPQIDWKMVDKRLGADPSLELLAHFLEPDPNETEESKVPVAENPEDAVQEGAPNENLMDESVLWLLASGYMQRNLNRTILPLLVENVDTLQDKRGSWPLSIIMFEAEALNLYRNRGDDRHTDLGDGMEEEIEDDTAGDHLQASELGNPGIDHNIDEILPPSRGRRPRNDVSFGERNLSYKKSQKWNKFTAGLDLYSWWNLLQTHQIRKEGTKFAQEPSRINGLSQYLPGLGAPPMNDWPPHSQAGRVLQSQAEHRDQIKKLASSFSADSLVLLNPESATELLQRQRFWEKTLFELSFAKAEETAQDPVTGKNPYAYTVRAEKHFLEDKLKTLKDELEALVGKAIAKERSKVPENLRIHLPRQMPDESMRVARELLLMKTVKLQKLGLKDRNPLEIEEFEGRVERTFDGITAPEADCGVCFLSSSHPYSMSSPIIDCEGRSCHAAFHKGCYQILAMNAFTNQLSAKRANQSKQSGNSSICIPCQTNMKSSVWKCKLCELKTRIPFIKNKACNFHMACVALMLLFVPSPLPKLLFKFEPTGILLEFNAIPDVMDALRQQVAATHQGGVPLNTSAHPKCLACGNDSGVVVPCGGHKDGSCENWLHPLCAYKFGAKLEQSSDKQAVFALHSDGNTSIADSGAYGTCMELFCPKCEYSKYEASNSCSTQVSASDGRSHPSESPQSDQPASNEQDKKLAFLDERLRQSYYRLASLNLESLGNKTWTEFQIKSSCKAIKEYYTTVLELKPSL